MRTLLIIFLIAAVATLACCTTHKGLKHAIAADTPPEAKARILTDFEKGKLGYKTECSSCHGSFPGGKKNISKIGDKELMKYTAGYILNDQPNHKSAGKLNPEQLHEIVVYLRYTIAEKTKVPVLPGGF